MGREIKPKKLKIEEKMMKNELTPIELKLQDAILEILSTYEDGKTTATNLRDRLISQGWAGLKSSGWWYSQIESLGFTVTTVNGSRHYVTLD